MRADLHTHSTFSDGLYTPDEVCRLAKEKGVELLSITDHDTLNGLTEKRLAAKRYGLAYVSGWEISAYEGMEKVHMLGYGCEPTAAYEAFTNARAEASLLRAEESVKKFRALGVDVTLAEVLQMRKEAGSPIHTMHVSRAAAKHLGIPSSEVYAKYLAPGLPANSNVGRPTPEQAIDCIHAIGGVAVIAHPERMTLGVEDREKLLIRLIEYGADGIEAYYTTHTEKDVEYFCALAKKLGVFVTGGSDTHFKDDTHEYGVPRFYASAELMEILKAEKP